MDINQRILNENISFIHLLFSDILGNLKRVEVPASRLDDVLDKKIKCDGSSIQGMARIVESDMTLAPDIRSFKVIYIYQEPIAIFFCNLLTHNKEVYYCDPRTILEKALNNLYEHQHYIFNIGFEPEFYLLKNNDFADNGRYFADNNEYSSAVRREIIKQLIKSGFNVEAGHHEVGPGQHEITFHYCSALQACDDILLFKMIVKEVANQHNLTATFIPKIKSGYPGNGMHVNMSLAQDNVNLFYDNGKISNQCLYFINGILTHACHIVAFTNPSINSYKRLFSGFEAPCFIAYSQNNRSALIRIPSSNAGNARAELRMVDPSCNPYLATALILNAGLDGLNRQLTVYQDIQSDIYKLNDYEKEILNIKTLPNNLQSALTMSANSLLVKETLGKELLDKFIAIKEKEINDYFQTISQWEYNTYFDC